MTTETMQASITVDASIGTVFDVLADPSTHQAIDGTGWVRESLDGQRLTQTGQIFGMAMYHENHPDGDYQMANKVVEFDAPTAVAWEPGQNGESGDIEFGGWIWRYDLEPTDADATRVTLTYDWSGVPAVLREHIPFPPFDQSHLENSLANLARIVS